MENNTQEQTQAKAVEPQEEELEPAPQEEAGPAEEKTAEEKEGKKKRRRVAWGALLVNIAILVALMLGGMLLVQPPTSGMLIGAAVYFVLSTVLKTIFLRYQRKGMKLAQARKFTEAEAAFSGSFDYFKQHPAIDKYRAITMLDYSNISYGEISLVNAGACCAMRGDYDAAKGWYRRAMEEYPDGFSGEVALEKLEASLQKEAEERARAAALSDGQGPVAGSRKGGFSKYDE